LFGRGEDQTQDLEPVQFKELERYQRVADRPESVCRDKKNAGLERLRQVQRTSLPGERRQEASGAFDQHDVGAGGVLADAANEIFEVDLPAFAVSRFRWGHGIAKSGQRVLGLCLTRRASQQGPVFRLRWGPWTSSFERLHGDDSTATSAQGPSQGATGPRLAHAGVRADDQ